MIERDSDGRLIIRPRRTKPVQGPTPSTAAAEQHALAYERPAPGAEIPSGVCTEKPDPSSHGEVRADDRGVLAEWMCGAKLRGERAGLLCRNPRMKGAKTCRMHGSATTMAREKAHERILMASDKAAKKLIEFMSDDNAPYSVKLAAARDLLDRADLAGKSTVEVEMAGFERALGMVRVRRGPRDETTPAIESGDIIDAEEVLEIEPHEPADRSPRSSLSPARAEGPPREAHVNSSDTPPAHIARKTPGYSTARTTEMRR